MGVWCVCLCVCTPVRCAREHNLCTRGRFILYTQLYGNSCNFLMQFTCALKCTVYMCMPVCVSIFFLYYSFEILPDFWFKHMPHYECCQVKFTKYSRENIAASKWVCVCEWVFGECVCKWQCVSYMWNKNIWNFLSCIPKHRSTSIHPHQTDMHMHVRSCRGNLSYGCANRTADYFISGKNIYKSFASAN